MGQNVLFLIQIASDPLPNHKVIKHCTVFVEPIGSTDCSKLATLGWRVNCQHGQSKQNKASIKSLSRSLTMLTHTCKMYERWVHTSSLYKLGIYQSCINRKSSRTQELAYALHPLCISDTCIIPKWIHKADCQQINHVMIMICIQYSCIR